MNQIYVFLIRNDVWIFVIAGIGLIWYLSQLIRARRSLRQAMFGLERERGQKQQRRAVTFSLILLAIIVMVAYVNIRIAPTIPADLLRPPTPTPDIFITPLSSPTPINSPATASPPLAPTVTLANVLQETPSSPDEPTAEATLIPTPPAVIGDCLPDSNITSPPSGSQVSGRFTVFGTAAGQDAIDYDLEIWGETTDGDWASILEERRPTPILDGILGSADLTGSPAGLYTLRLRMFNAGSETVGQCAIQVEFNSPGE